jgi:PAS domain S-box-containing protein
MRRLAELLKAQREEIIRRWEQAVLADPSIPQARQLTECAHRDHVPQLLDELASLLEYEAAAPHEAKLGRDFGAHVLPAEHAQDRFNAGYTLSALLRELSHLRDVVVDLMAEQQNLDARGKRLLHAALDECMTTAAVQMEQASGAAVRRERDRLVDVLKLLPVGVFVSDAAGAELATNDAFSALWGTGRQKVTSRQQFDTFVAYDARTGERIGADDWGLAIALSSGRTVRDQEVEIDSSDGTRRTMLNSAAPLLDHASGQTIGGVAVTVDVTDMVRTLRRLQDEAELRDTFIGILGHDLRTPLSTIKLRAKMVECTALDDKHAESISRIGRAADLMDRMISDLLDFARARAAKILTSGRPDDLRAILDEVVLDFRHANPGRCIVLEIHGQGRGAWDRDRLLQVFGNLLGNAISYSPPDTPIFVRLDGVEANVRVSVHNAGAPIPADQLEVLFEPFRRGTGEQKRVGLGLGLFIAREIVEAHGGTIHAECTARGGTTFVVVLPRAADARNHCAAGNA